MQFKNYTKHALDFIDILPPDWQSTILPIWVEYAVAKEVYVLIDRNEILAGGIIASGIPRDMVKYKTHLGSFEHSHHRYIGYLWVIPSKRASGLGSLWLQLLQQNFPDFKFWLSVEEEGLVEFYKKNGFMKWGCLEDADQKEWVLQTP